MYQRLQKLRDEREALDYTVIPENKERFPSTRSHIDQIFSDVDDSSDDETHSSN